MSAIGFRVEGAVEALGGEYGEVFEGNSAIVVKICFEIDPTYRGVSLGDENWGAGIVVCVDLEANCADFGAVVVV